MNLPPALLNGLAARGLSAVHWSAIGEPTAADDEILAWARVHAHVLVTHDLEFSAILAASGDRAPSVIQLRFQDLASPAVAAVVDRVVAAHAGALSAGALVSVSDTGERVRVLPPRRE